MFLLEPASARTTSLCCSPSYLLPPLLMRGRGKTTLDQKQNNEQQKSSALDSQFYLVQPLPGKPFHHYSLLAKSETLFHNPIVPRFQQQPFSIPRSALNKIHPLWKTDTDHKRTETNNADENENWIVTIFEAPDSVFLECLSSLSVQSLTFVSAIIMRHAYYLGRVHRRRSVPDLKRVGLKKNAQSLEVLVYGCESDPLIRECVTDDQCQALGIQNAASWFSVLSACLHNYQYRFDRMLPFIRRIIHRSTHSDTQYWKTYDTCEPLIISEGLLDVFYISRFPEKSAHPKSRVSSKLTTIMTFLDVDCRMEWFDITYRFLTFFYSVCSRRLQPKIEESRAYSLQSGSLDVAIEYLEDYLYMRSQLLARCLDPCSLAVTHFWLFCAM